MDAKRLGNILDEHARLVTQRHGVHLKASPYRLIFCGPGLAMGTHSVRLECQLNRNKLRVRSMEGLGVNFYELRR